MLGMAAGGIYWLAALFEKVENQQVQIASLQGGGEQARSHGCHRKHPEDIVRLERGHDRLHEELDKRGMEREDYRKRSHVWPSAGTVDDRLVQAERALGWRDHYQWDEKAAWRAMI